MKLGSCFFTDSIGLCLIISAQISRTCVYLSAAISQGISQLLRKISPDAPEKIKRIHIQLEKHQDDAYLFISFGWLLGYLFLLNDFFTSVFLCVLQVTECLAYQVTLPQQTVPSSKTHLFTLDGDHIPQNVVLYAAFFGSIFGFGLSLQFVKPSLFGIGIYIMFLSTFHTMEYVSTALVSKKVGLNGT